MPSFVGDLVAAVGSDPGAWVRDPVGEFRRTRDPFMAAVGKFEKRRRALRLLEAQNVSIGVFAVSLPPGNPARQRLADAYADNLAKLESLRGQADAIAAQVRKGLEALQSLRQLVLRVPGGQFLTGLGVPLAFAGFAVVVIGATAAITAWIVYADHVAGNQGKLIDFYKGLNIPDDEKAKRFAEAQSRGGNNDSKAWWKDLGEKTASGVLLVVAGALLLPMLLKSLKR